MVIATALESKDPVLDARLSVSVLNATNVVLAFNALFLLDKTSAEKYHF
jgi:hypothetical protein